MARAKKGSDPIKLLAFDQMAGNLNDVSTPFGDGGLYEFFIRTLSICLDPLCHIWSNCDD